MSWKDRIMHLVRFVVIWVIFKASIWNFCLRIRKTCDVKEWKSYRYNVLKLKLTKWTEKIFMENYLKEFKEDKIKEEEYNAYYNSYNSFFFYDYTKSVNRIMLTPFLIIDRSLRYNVISMYHEIGHMIGQFTNPKCKDSKQRELNADYGALMLCKANYVPMIWLIDYVLESARLLKVSENLNAVLDDTHPTFQEQINHFQKHILKFKRKGR